MPLPKHILEDLAARRARENEAAERDEMRLMMVTSAWCIFWSLAGILSILWSAHTTNLFHGRIAFYAGIGLGNGGILFTLLNAYRVGEKRGYW
jgi:hypothetical protein